MLANSVKALGGFKSGQTKSNKNMNETTDKETPEVKDEPKKEKEIKAQTVLVDSDEDTNKKSDQSFESHESSSSNPNVNTTANGDGISFTVGQPCMFELIYRIKNDLPLSNTNKKNNASFVSSEQASSEQESSEEEERLPIKNDLDMSLPELPQNLKPISLLIEVVH